MRRPCQFSIRQVLLANVVAALWATVFVGLDRLSDGNAHAWPRWLTSYFATVITSITCWLASLILLAPGPRRDRILGGFRGLWLTLLGIFLVAHLFVIPLGRLPYWLRAVMYFYSSCGVLIVAAGSWMIVRMVVPGRCPGCGERALVKIIDANPGIWFGAHWCEVCQGRWIRKRGGVWADASSPEFDGRFWLETSGQSFRKALQRLRGYLRFRWR